MRLFEALGEDGGQHRGGLCSPGTARGRGWGLGGAGPRWERPGTASRAGGFPILSLFLLLGEIQQFVLTGSRARGTGRSFPAFGFQLPPRRGWDRESRAGWGARGGHLWDLARESAQRGAAFGAGGASAGIQQMQCPSWTKGPAAALPYGAVGGARDGAAPGQGHPWGAPAVVAVLGLMPTHGDGGCLRGC